MWNLSIALLLLSSFALSNEDPRVALTFDEAPGKYVGRIYADGNYRCTGWLSGPDIVHTAGHCATNKEIASQKFEFALHDALGAEVERVPIKATRNFAAGTKYEHATATDSAIMVLSRALGLEHGWMDIYPLKPPVGTEIASMGYSSDWLKGSSPSIHKKCKVTSHANALERFMEAGRVTATIGLFETNCRGGQGASGGPITAALTALGLPAAEWGSEPLVVGMTSAALGLVRKELILATSSTMFALPIVILNAMTIAVRIELLCTERKDCELFNEFKLDRYLAVLGEYTASLKAGDLARLQTELSGVFGEKPLDQALTLRRLRPRLMEKMKSLDQ